MATSGEVATSARSFWLGHPVKDAAATTGCAGFAVFVTVPTLDFAVLAFFLTGVCFPSTPPAGFVLAGVTDVFAGVVDGTAVVVVPATAWVVTGTVVDVGGAAGVDEVVVPPVVVPPVVVPVVVGG